VNVPAGSTSILRPHTLSLVDMRGQSQSWNTPNPPDFFVCLGDDMCCVMPCVSNNTCVSPLCSSTVLTPLFRFLSQFNGLEKRLGEELHMYTILTAARRLASVWDGSNCMEFSTLWKPKLLYLDDKGRPSPWSESNYLLTYILTYLHITYLFYFFFLSFFLSFFLTYTLTFLLTYLLIYTLLTYFLSFLITYLHTYFLSHLIIFFLSFLLIYIHTYLLTNLLTYFLSFLFTYQLTFLLTYLLTFLLITYLLSYLLS
jgi:hypothetical protein